MDGLLLDTETAYTVAQQEILTRFGKEFTWTLKAKMMGKKALDAAQVLIEDLDLAGQITAEEFVAERETILDVLFSRSGLLPGVDRLVRHLSSNKVPIAVATSSHRRHFELKTSLHTELFGLFDVVVTGDAVAKLSAAVGDPGLSPRSTLVFEDAPSGVDAGLAAGMQVVMVPDSNLDAALRGKAHQELGSLESFDPVCWGLPPFPQ